MAHPSEAGGTLFIEEAPEFEIIDGVARIKACSGSVSISLCCSPHNLLLAIRRATDAYQEWESRGVAPSPIKSGGDHAASS